MLDPGAGRRLPDASVWADEVRDIGVRANADTPADARDGAQLQRRRHRAVPDRAHVLRRRPPDGDARDDLCRHAADRARRRWRGCCRCSARISSQLFEIMQGLPVCIRLFDPPLHEFLPIRARRAARAGRGAGPAPGRGHAAGRGADRVQPDAGHAGRAARRRRARDLRHAGPGDLRGDGRGDAQAARRWCPRS